MTFFIRSVIFIINILGKFTDKVKQTHVRTCATNEHNVPDIITCDAEFADWFGIAWVPEVPSIDRWVLKYQQHTKKDEKFHFWRIRLED